MSAITTLKARLTKLAVETAHNETSPGVNNDEFCPDDVAGGNVDDGYYGGQRDGEIYLAREVLEALEKAGL